MRPGPCRVCLFVFLLFVCDPGVLLHLLVVYERVLLVCGGVRSVFGMLLFGCSCALSTARVLHQLA